MMDPREMQRRSVEARRAREAIRAPGAVTTTVLDQTTVPREAPASPPARESRSWDTSAIRERQEQEATRLTAELDALYSKPDARFDQVYKLRGMLLKLLRALGRGAPTATPTTGKPAPTVADLIRRAEADPAGDEPEELRGV